jgi:hypothetical protein
LSVRCPNPNATVAVMLTATHWHFDGDDLVVVTRIPPLPAALLEPVNSLCHELAGGRQGMEDFLEAWRDHKRRKHPDPALIGRHCEIHIAGHVVHVAPLRKGQWRSASEAWIPLVAVEEMFAAYAAWAFGGRAVPVPARQGG